MEWTAGEELVCRYKVPEAERFATVFCRNCGSPLPRVALERNIAVIPAGSLDSSPDIQPTARIFYASSPDIQPTARIFYASKTAWSCEAGKIPAWDEYPQKS
jgi:hypothetical protein